MKGDTVAASSSMESQRIYWQQWPSASKSPTALSRRDLITSSAAIRISAKGARARDVTQLLCDTLNLNKDDSNKDNNKDVSSSPSWDYVQDAWEQDCLVLVGTLYSLPYQYVRFEHERLDALMNGTSTTRPALSSSEEVEVSLGKNRPTPTFVKTDPPFHVIKTLSADDNPMEQRHRMMQHLQKILAESTAAFAFTANGAKKHSTSVSPKLQWYFVPGSHHPTSPITSYIDLDGYSTSLEEEEEDAGDDDDTETDENDTADDVDSLSDDYLQQQEQGSSQANIADEACLEGPSRQETTSDTMETNALEDHDGQPSKKVNTIVASEKERIFQKERQRYLELAMCQSSLQHDCLSGYMLKQSMSDPHVWKRVHCVLTDEHLWYISRIHTRLDRQQGSVKESEDSFGEHGEEKKQMPPSLSSSSETPMEFYSYAKHRRLGLTRALLIQPSKDRPKAPLFRTPFAFEVIDSNGAAHRFRATNLDSYKRWVTALSSRIVQSYENSLFEHAELIVRDETQARNKRMMAVAVEPLWEYCLLREKSKPKGHDKTRFSPLDLPTLQILRFGMEVSEYRERCRHVQAILPAKYPVLAMTDTKPELRRNSSGSGHSEESSPSSNGAFRLDSKTQALIKGAWDEAVRLGGQATKLAVALQCPPGGSTSSPTTKMPRCLETICQHLEHVITGNFRGSLTINSSSSQQGSNKSTNAKQARGPDNTRQYPPPIDLFDQLLAELQLVAASASTKGHLGTASQPSSRSVANGSTRHVTNEGSYATIKKT
jgi:hypothetical protein